MDRIECQWCQAQNEIGRPNCLTCGAPLDVKDLVTDSGWAEAPRLRDIPRRPRAKLVDRPLIADVSDDLHALVFAPE